MIFAQAERRVSTLMGDKVEPRRKWIESHVEFSLEDGGSILENSQMMEASNEQVALFETEGSVEDGN